jgi:hypothetical protein
VELQAGGEPAELEAFLTAIGESELRAHIKAQTRHAIELPASVRGFQILHG